MLKIAIPNKGSLSEESVAILKECGYKCKRRGRELIVIDEANSIEFVYLRPRDIAVYVGSGIIELGITGRDLAIDSSAPVKELLSLNFGNSKFFYAAPKNKNLSLNEFNGKRIATSYATIVKKDLEKRGINADVVKLDGAVEISVRLGVADIIADVVSSGLTLKEAGLEIIGTPILESEAILVSGYTDVAEHTEAKKLIDRLQGILHARTYAVVEYDGKKDALSVACKITPGIESPTVSPLAEENWIAVKSMIKRKEINSAMDKLKEIGAKGIIVTDIRTCRL
jgi:ATP phosphoribosyltransferase